MANYKFHSIDFGRVNQLLFFLAVFLIFLLPPTDPDLGWHLRCGEQIWQKGLLCSQNQFSVLLEGYHWVNHYWLYQAVIFPIFKIFGLWGLTILNGLLMTITFFFWYSAIKNFRFEKMIAAGIIIFLGFGVFSFGIRSQLLGLFYFNLILWLFSKFQTKPNFAFFLPLVMLIWANSHGSVILGLILIFFLGIVKIITEPNHLLSWVLIFLASFLVTLINPFSFGIYQEAWRHFGGQKLALLIAEWVPPDRNVWWLILASSLILSLYLFAKGTTKSFIHPFSLLPFCFLALSARRYLPFYFSFAFYLFLTTASKSFFKENLVLLAAFLFFALGFFIRLPQTLAVNSSWESFCQNSPVNYPYQAVEFLRKQPASWRGNIFNRYEWGGFLIWQLPDFKIFVDGRMPAWLAEAPLSGAKAARYISPYTIYLETLQTQPGWQETLNEYKINWLLISPGTFMDLLLSPNPEKFGWQEVFRNEISVIYKRKGITS